MTAMTLVVQKFGGTSLADAAKIHRAARKAIRAKVAGHQVVLVVSAMGGTTDQLVELARAVCSRPPRFVGMTPVSILSLALSPMITAIAVLR